MRALYPSLFFACFLLSACPGPDPAPVADVDVVADATPDANADVPATGPPFDYCSPDTPPNDACFASKRAPDSADVTLARAIADKQLAAHAPETVGWDWAEAVMMVGLQQLHRVTGDSTYRDYVKAWLDHHIAEGYNIATSDSCAPTAMALDLWAETGDAAYRAVIDDAFHYMAEVSLRDENGGLNHLGDTDLLGISLWVDSLFMFGNVLIGQGEHGNDPTALDEFASQHAIFKAELQTDGGFFVHASDGWLLPQTPGIFWGRGNAWVTAAAYDYLRVRKIRGETDDAVAASVALQTEAFRATQDAATGLWWSIVNRPDEIYLETSTGALLAFGLARGYRYGYVGDEVLGLIESAMAGVRSRIIDQAGVPTVTGVSGPTTAGTFADYAAVQTVDDVEYGLGAVLLALTEVSGLPAAP